MKKPAKKTTVPPPLRPDVRKVYRVTNYHTGDFVATCVEKLFRTARYRVNAAGICAQRWRRDRGRLPITGSNRGCEAVKTVPIAGRLLQLRCATCNKVQEPSSSKAIELFGAAHWFHAGYTLLVEIAEPSEISGDTVELEVARVK